MQLDTLFLTPVQAYVSHQTKAPVVAIKNGETGFYPIHTTATVETLNDGEVPKEIVESAVAASIVGWHAPVAQAAKVWFAQRAEAAVNAEG